MFRGLKLCTLMMLMMSLSDELVGSKMWLEPSILVNPSIHVIIEYSPNRNEVIETNYLNLPLKSSKSGGSDKK